MNLKLKNQSGFTLIEMAVVLVIIGLILGAVSIGKDLQRTAEYKKIKQKYVDQWAIAYNQYYEKMGVVLGDYQTKPTLAVNAAELGGTTFTQPASHDFTRYGNMPRLCEGAPGVLADLDVQHIAGATSMFGLFDKAGIRMPPGRTEGREDRYVYLDTNGNPQEAEVCFQWNHPGTPSNSGNVMVISGLTPDLARHLDEMIDGKADAQEGLFRQQSIGNGVAGTSGVEWTQSNRVNAAAADANLDEDQIITVTAHYKMNQ